MVILLTIAVVAAIGGIVAGVIYLSVRAMSDPDLALEPVDRDDHEHPFAAFDDYHDWAAEQGFKWIGAYVLRGVTDIYVGAWRHPTQSLYFCVYMAQGNMFTDLVTIFDDEHGLTTCSSADTLTLPQPPGAYRQVFTDLTIDEQYQRHLEAEVLLTERLRMQPQPISEPFERVVIDAIHRQMAYVKSLPGWPIRGVWWYLTRLRKINRSVEDQLENSPG